jgi:hypothetical protein
MRRTVPGSAPVASVTSQEPTSLVASTVAECDEELEGVDVGGAAACPHAARASTASAPGAIRAVVVRLITAPSCGAMWDEGHVAVLMMVRRDVPHSGSA